MTTGRAAGALALTLLWAFSPSARAESAEAMARGLEQVRAFEYDEAIATYQSIIDDAAATPAERLAALERIAVIEFNRDHQDRARELFGELIDRDPERPLTEGAYPPPVEAFFSEVREGHSAGAAVSPTVEAEASGGQVTLRASFTAGGDAVEAARAFLRAPGGAFEPAEMTREGESFRLERPEPAPGEALDYYVTFHAPSGHQLAAVGSEADPRRVEAAPPEPEPEPEPERRPVVRTWWFWTIIGVVVAGGVAAGVAIPLSNDEPPSGSLGSVQLQ